MSSPKSSQLAGDRDAFRSHLHAALPSRQWLCRSQPPRAVPRPHPGTRPGKQGQPQPHSTSPPGPSEPEWEIFTLAEPAKLQGSSRITTITQIN